MTSSDVASSPFALAQEAAKAIAEATGVTHHDIALTLGSGWGKAADLVGETKTTLQASEVPGFSSSGVPGHSGTHHGTDLRMAGTCFCRGPLASMSVPRFFSFLIIFQMVLKFC